MANQQPHWTRENCRRPSPGAASLDRAHAARCAFTIVELLTVIAIIILILAIGIPAFSNMSEQARFGSSIEAVQGALSRAYYNAVADNCQTAVRFVRGDWLADERGATGGPRPGERMYLVQYRKVATTDRPNKSSGADKLQVSFSERLEPVPDSTPVQLAQDVWAAPIEALTTTSADLGVDHPLRGRPGIFERLWTEQSANDIDGRSKADVDFLGADDFLIVFDPGTGVRRGKSDDVPLIWGSEPLTGVNPKFETLRRRAYTGIVFYPRENLLALGVDATVNVRQNFLRRYGRPYYVSRYGGDLVAGGLETP